MTKKGKAKFEINDEVIIVSNNTKGIVKDIVSYLGDGDNIYLVSVDKKDKMCVESNLKLSRKSNVNISIDINEMSINFQIEDRIKEIISVLDLKESDDPAENLFNACKLQMYLTINDEYDDTYINVGNSVTKNELYHGLVNGDFDSIINSYIFSEILKKVGMNVLNVAMKSEDNQFYMSNLVLINGEYYYFDVTLEMAVYQENGAKEDEFVLCCGALGKTSYEQFFKPLCVLDFNDKMGDNSLPNNISREDIDIDVVNKMLTMGIGADEK